MHKTCEQIVLLFWMVDTKIFLLLDFSVFVFFLPPAAANHSFHAMVCIKTRAFEMLQNSVFTGFLYDLNLQYLF